MDKGSYYAVHKGRATGVFSSWKEVVPLVDKFPGAKFKKFNQRADAESFVLSGVSGSDSGVLSTPTEAMPDTEIGRVHVFCDGGHSPKTLRSGLGVAFSSPHRALAVSNRLPNGTTNQQAELEAIVAALRQIDAHLREHAITLWTDSDYSIKCLTQYIHVWRKKGWTTASGGVVKHRELIEDGRQRLDRLLNVRIRHISEVGLKSHQPNPGSASALTMVVWEGNSRADDLATDAMK